MTINISGEARQFKLVQCQRPPLKATDAGGLYPSTLHQPFPFGDDEQISVKSCINIHISCSCLPSRQDPIQ